VTAEQLTREEKLRFLRALEEDAEFRYAVAGAIGLLSVLEELRKLRENFNRFVEIEERRWEGHTKILGEHTRRLEELTKVVGELKVAVGSLGRRLGRDLERTILELYRYTLKEVGVEVDKVEKFTYRDVDGRYTGGVP